MTKLVQSKSFKKDLKKYAHKNDVLRELGIVVELLVANKPIPAKYKNHYLNGAFRSYTQSTGKLD